ncbi:MAG: DNA alkylation repair protein [Oscillospiraceae bacterium]|nr:DNA alkylation repair protein [Oscillospiraceae bacterium]
MSPAPASRPIPAASLRERLLAMSEPGYRAFSARLIPDLPPERILGVRSPALWALARELRGSDAADAFLGALPHLYQEENLLHGYLLAFERDFDRCLARVEAFLPWVDNWAVCDSLSLPCFKKHRQTLAEAIPGWLASGKTYTVRFGIKQLMDHFLEEDFDPAFPAAVAALRSEEYYVNMMRAWYFATALAKQWDAILPYFTQRRLDPWTHAKSIQKAVESFRVSPEQKALLRGLR